MKNSKFILKDLSKRMDKKFFDIKLLENTLIVKDNKNEIVYTILYNGYDENNKPLYKISRQNIITNIFEESFLNLSQLIYYLDNLILWENNSARKTFIKGY